MLLNIEEICKFNTTEACMLPISMKLVIDINTEKKNPLVLFV